MQVYGGKNDRKEGKKREWAAYLNMLAKKRNCSLRDFSEFSLGKNLIARWPKSRWNAAILKILWKLEKSRDKTFARLIFRNILARSSLNFVLLAQNITSEMWTWRIRSSKTIFSGVIYFIRSFDEYNHVLLRANRRSFQYSDIEQ